MDEKLNESMYFQVWQEGRTWTYLLLALVI